MRDNYMIYYLEELIFTALESTALLTIVHKNGRVINNWHLSKALLGIQEYIEHCKNANTDECTNHNVVLSHCIIRSLRSLEHS